MSLQLCISYLNKHIVILRINISDISLRLLRSVNTLNSKLKFKTILNKQITTTTESSVSWSHLNFSKVYCSKTLMYSSTLRPFLSAIRSCMLHIPNSAEGNCLTEKENHTLCLKSDVKSKTLRITKIYM